MPSLTQFLPVAYEIAKTYPDSDLLPRVKAEYLRITNSSPLPYVGEWLAYFDLMLNNIREKRLFSDKEKQDLVVIIENRLSALISLDPNSTGDAKLNPFSVKDVAEKLATFYKQTNDVTNKERVISYVENSFRAVLPQANPLQQLAWLGEVQKCYSKFGMTTQAQALYADIQNAGIKAKDALQPYEVLKEIPVEMVEKSEQMIKEIIQGTEDDVFGNFVYAMLPKLNDIKALVKIQTVYPFKIQILSDNGLPLSVINDETGKEYRTCAQLIKFEEPVMRMMVQSLQEHQVFTHEGIVKHIMASGLIDADRQEVIEKGVQFYLNGDGVTACHLLMPQIEHAICNLALKKNAPALRGQRAGDGYMIQLMDKLFDVKEIKDALGDDVVFYLRALLTEQRGLNLRNDLCHGNILLIPSQFHSVILISVPGARRILRFRPSGRWRAACRS